MFENRRHFRILYPANHRPELIINGRVYRVIDVSVSGLRFETKVDFIPDLGDKIIATMGFFTGPRLTLRGQVVKIIDLHVMITLDQYIPKQVLKVEADALLDNYGAVPTDRY